VPAEGRHRRGRGGYCRDEIGTTGPDQHGSPGRQAADIGPQRKLRSPGCGRQGRSVSGNHSERNANTVRSRQTCGDLRSRRRRLVAPVERLAQQQANQVGERDTPRSCPLDQLALEAAEIDDEHVSSSMRLRKHPSRSVYYVGAEGAYPAFTMFLVSSTIDAIEMPDFDANPACALAWDSRRTAPSRRL